MNTFFGLFGYEAREDRDLLSSSESLEARLTAIIESQPCSRFCETDILLNVVYIEWQLSRTCHRRDTKLPILLNRRELLFDR